MPQLDLTELELKVAWLILDENKCADPTFREAEQSLFAKVYRAYRGMPPREAA